MQGITDKIITYIVAHPLMIVLVIWGSVWKLIALWKAARRNHLTIFIVLAILNTAGILEICYIIYLYITEKKRDISNSQN